VIPTNKRLDYAAGFIGLGMLDEASDELEAIAFTDRFFPEVLLARIELYMKANQWDMVVNLARALIKQRPEEERPWIALAYALRRQKQIAEAREILLTAEPLHGKTSSILHYDLACYSSLLGDQDTAKERLNQACKMDKNWKEAALNDHDLKSLWDEIESMK
jgi:predicted Zn-dependent protease